MMRCEVCGRIKEKLTYAIIEGARLLVCGKCAKLGTPVAARRALPRRPAPKPGVPEDVEVAPNFGRLIRRARERLGLSLQDLAEKIKEKASVLRRLEQERVAPNAKLAGKLEHVLGVRLFIPKTEPAVKAPSKRREFSIGDLARVKKTEET